jgi:peptidyl-prolyl cis-trans isomerase D
MPFEIFRRHQRKLLATFAILAMFGFVVSDSLPKLLNPSYSGRDQPVVTLYGQTVYRSALNAMVEQRTLANMFVGELGYRGQNLFGGTKDREIVDALILQHEADRLGMPGGPELGQEYLKVISGGRMTSSLFEAVLGRLNNRVSGEQLLRDIANQVRLRRVQALLGAPLVTPYDVFAAYRDQNERVSAKLIELPVEKFLGKVPDPSPAEIQAMYESYKDVLPDPVRETPGFKVPRRIRFDILSIDGNALVRSIKEKLTESELRTAYENRKGEYPEPSELPRDLFGGQPELTPPVPKPFAEIRSVLAAAVAEDRAQAAIVEKFNKIKDEVLIPFSDEYSAAVDELEEARKHNPKATKVLPSPVSLDELAKAEGLNHEQTKPLSHEEADRYGQISTAEVGMTLSGGGRRFADEFFDPRKRLFEPEELTDLLGTRFLVRKIEDIPAHMAPLDEVRAEVILACKMAKARALAEKAAGEVADRLKKKGGALKDGTFEEYHVVTIPPITRRQSSLLPSLPNRLPFESGPPEDTPIVEVPHAGDAFRDAYFGLQTGSIAMAANQPRTIFYVMTLERRDPATFAALYAPNGDELRYKLSAERQATQQLIDEWMGWLRQQAGLKPDWVAPDEAKGKAAAEEA